MTKSTSTKWTKKFAYAVGLLTADGCLYSDGRHIEFTSKDKEQVLNFAKCLALDNKITKKTRVKEKIKKYYRIQFGNKALYNFFCSIGLSPRKSLILKQLDIPMKFFPDFLRGLFDGDGNFNIFRHPESQYDQIRFRITSSSPQFLRWIHQITKNELSVKGFISRAGRSECLEFAIEDSLKILKYIYYSPTVVRLSRKFDKAKPYMK
jgi:intein/homing endonuclease